MSRQPEVHLRRRAAVAGTPVAAGAGNRGDRPVRRDSPDAIPCEVGDEEAPIRCERDADRLLDGRLDRRTPVAVRAGLAGPGEDLALPGLGIDTEHLVEETVGDVDLPLGVHGEVIRQFEHRFGSLDRGGGLACGVLSVATAAGGEEQQDEDGVPAHRPWYTEARRSVPG